MADLIHDANYKVAFVPGTTLSKTAPSAATITAGTPLDPYMTPGGLNRAASNATIDNSRLNSTFGTGAVGRRSFDLSITVIRDSADAGGIEAALTYQTLGFIVIRDNISSATAWTAAQKAEVYPVQVGAANKAAPAANELQTITYTFTMTGDAGLTAVLAA